MSKISVLTALLLGICVSNPVVAQGPTTPPTIMDIPLLDRQEMGARWAGIGGACVAVVDDGSAAYWNPAGLGRIRRIEFLGTLNNLSTDIESEWSGMATKSSISATRLGNLAVSYPFPTYRGSLVATGSVFRKISSDQFLKRRVDADPYDFHETEERKYILTAWSGALAMQLSPNVFFGAEAHYYSGDAEERNVYAPWEDPCNTTGAILQTDADIDGYGATIGLQYIAHPMVSAGVVLRSPENLDIEGSSNVFPECVPIDILFKDEITLPYSVGIGLAFMPPDFLVACDVVYTNWHELDYGAEGRVRDEETGAFLYDATTDVRVGAEYSLPMIPIRFRAGYAYVPLELNLFDIEKNKHRYSIGGGTVIEAALAIDVAWQRTSFERKSPADEYKEARTIDQVIVTAAYRF